MMRSMSDLTQRKIAEQNEILRTLNGSRLYGTNVDSSDEDQMAVFIEDPNTVFLRGMLNTVQLRDKPQGVRSESGDVDCTSYSLRHLGHLAMAGNPSVLTLFSSPMSSVISSTALGRKLLAPDVARMFASKAAGPRFLGYMQSQKQRMVGEKKGHVPKRPELIEKYGFDTKYANHVIRLGLQGHEFMTSGRMSLPMKDHDVELLLAVRNGEFCFQEVIGMIEALEDSLMVAVSLSRLPDEPDKRAIAALFKSMHEVHWNIKQPYSIYGGVIT